MSKYTMQTTVSSQPPKQICTHFRLFCSPPPRESRVSGYSWRSQFNSPRLVKREAGFPNPRRALIGSNQLWRVNDSPYYREYVYFHTDLNSALHFCNIILLILYTLCNTIQNIRIIEIGCIMKPMCEPEILYNEGWCNSTACGMQSRTKL